MAEINGRLVSCDRCDAQIFQKTTGDGEADGGYTRWNKFEPLPTGWDFVHIPIAPEKGRRVDTYIRVCPTCNNLWRTLLNENFLANTRHYLKSVEITGLTGDSN